MFHATCPAKTVVLCKLRGNHRSRKASEDGHRWAKGPWESCVILSRDRFDSGKALAGLYRVHRYESLVERACHNGWSSKLTEQNMEIASHGSNTANMGFELLEIRGYFQSTSNARVIR